MNMIVYGCAVVGILAGGLFGDRQMRRWEIYEKKRWILFLAGIIILFLAGGWLMQVYDYHILKIIRYWIVMYALFLLAFLDYRKQIIPNRALLLMLGVRTLLLVMDCLCFPQIWAEVLVSSLVGLCGGGLIFLAARLISRRGIGMGDVKLISVLGYYLGFQVLMSDLVLSLLLTVAGGIIQLIVRRVSMRSEMPFVPFVAAGTVITIFLGC